MDTQRGGGQFHFPLRKMKPRPFLSSGNLKRSKSLHCSSSAHPNDAHPSHGAPMISSSQQMNGSGQTNHQNSGIVYGRPYGQRRHHSTNDYEDEDFIGFVRGFDPLPLASSSHNLYYQFQNMPLPSSPHTPTTPSSTKYQPRSSLPSIGNERIVSRSNLRKKSQPEMFAFPDGGENDSTGSDETPIWWDDFVLEELADSMPTNVKSSATSGVYQNSQQSRRTSTSSTISGPASPKKTSDKFGEQKCRFYIIKQRNYPPLYLENCGIRRRIYRVLVLGYPSSGKTSLVEQFFSVVHNDGVDMYGSNGSSSTQSYIETDHHFDPSLGEQLNERRNLLVHFLECDSFDRYLLQAPVTDYQPDVYLILFSINNRDSFNAVKKTLVDLQRWDDVETKSIIIVANKTDLVRGRCITRREGRDLASANNCKYIETSCTISHQIEELLQGIGCQVLLKEDKQREEFECNAQDVSPLVTNGVGGVGVGANNNQRTSTVKRKPSFFKRILRRTAMNKSKSCDNLHVL